MKAYINHGRWLVNCPNCNNGEIVAVGLALTACHMCGGAIEPEYPANYAEIEAALQMRPRVNRNWDYRETVADLLDENRKHGVLI